MTLPPLSILAFSLPCLFASAPLPNWVLPPTELHAPAVKGFLQLWNKDNHTSKPWIWFLCIEVTDVKNPENISYLEPPNELLESLNHKFTNILPLSMAEPIPSEWPAEILQKGTKKPGAYLRIGLARQLSPTKWEVSISFFAGSHYGAGYCVTVKLRKGQWVATNVRSTFES